MVVEGSRRSLILLSMQEEYLQSFFFSSRRRHTRLQGDWSSDVCSSDLLGRGRSSQRGARCGETRRDRSMTGRGPARVNELLTNHHNDGFARSNRNDEPAEQDRKSTRLNSSHLVISYAVFCLKNKNRKIT